MFKLTRHSLILWRGGRVVECGGLENRCPQKGPWVRIPPSPPGFANPRLQAWLTTPGAASFFK